MLKGLIWWWVIKNRAKIDSTNLPGLIFHSPLNTTNIFVSLSLQIPLVLHFMVRSLPVDISVFWFAIQDLLCDLLELVHRQGVEPEPPVLQTLRQDELFVAARAHVEVHPVPVEVLVLFRLELNPRNFVIFGVCKRTRIFMWYPTT